MKVINVLLSTKCSKIQRVWNQRDWNQCCCRTMKQQCIVCDDALKLAWETTMPFDSCRYKHLIWTESNSVGFGCALCKIHPQALSDCNFFPLRSEKWLSLWKAYVHFSNLIKHQLKNHCSCKSLFFRKLQSRRKGCCISALHFKRGLWSNNNFGDKT